MSGQEPHSGAGKSGSWRGRKSPAASRWSAAAKGAGWAQQPDRSAESATRWHRIKVGLWLLLAIGLIAGFLVYLMYRPMRTPLLMAAVTRYAPPWPPNAWAQKNHCPFHGVVPPSISKCLDAPPSNTIRPPPGAGKMRPDAGEALAVCSAGRFRAGRHGSQTVPPPCTRRSGSVQPIIT